MSMLARYLPRHDFSETHSIHIAAPPAAVLDAVARADLTDDPLVRALLRLRGLPLRLRRRLNPQAAVGEDVWSGFGLHRFTPLGRDADREIAFGLAGRFWEASGGLVPVADAQAFEHFKQPGAARLVMTWIAQPQAGGTQLTTITRVACPDEATRKRFAPYWYLIRPASGFIRGRALRRVKKMAESG
ncbi:MAG: hypothetical protein AB7P37_07505 [Ramlibacter sp.]